MRKWAGAMDKRRRRIFDIIQIGNTSDLPSRLFDFLLAAVILVNITAMFLETFGELERFYPLFGTAENVTILFFCAEYALRIWTADFLYPGLSRGRAAVRFMVSFDGVIDLLTILPFFWLSGFIAFRMLRVVRIFHLFRINAYYDSFNVITTVLYEKRNQLISSLFFIFILMLASSLCMYSAEHAAQPEVFRNAFSGIWWSVSTLLTVGYGDIYPVTAAGRALAIVIAFLGVGAVAVPTGIISAGFVEQYGKLTHSVPVPGTVLQTVGVDIDSKWLGRTLKELKLQYGFEAVALTRGEKPMPLRPHLRIEKGDLLTVRKCPDEPAGPAAEGR